MQLLGRSIKKTSTLLGSLKEANSKIYAATFDSQSEDYILELTLKILLSD